MQYPKYVQVNTRSLSRAIREAVNPMSQWYDARHDDLPFFENIVNGERFGNYHHTSWSAGHCAARWMESLYRAMRAGENVDPAAYEKCKKWVFRVYEDGVGLPANIDLTTFTLLKESDLCNLRESFYGLACIYLCERDPRALSVARRVIDTVDRFLDKHTGAWDDARCRAETGVHGVGLFTGDRQTTRFCNTFGRFIGGLTVFYQATGEGRALRLALELANIALSGAIAPDGSFDPQRTAPHLYSTTSMLSGIAFLAGLTGERTLFERLDAFMRAGFYEVALPCGWVRENTGRSDLVGEINDSCDLLEVCLELGKAGYPGYFSRAERMLRGHILPSQLLDTSFICDDPSPDISRDRMASRVRGAFGFPCPYGHEYAPGSEISFNWDIVGGVSGICRARDEAVTRLAGALTSVNLLFDHHDELLEVKSPYGNGDVLGLCSRVCAPLRVRLPWNIDLEATRREIAALPAQTAILGEWLYLSDPLPGRQMNLRLWPRDTTERYHVSGHDLAMRWRGEEVTGATSPGKRLCFFPEI